MEVVAQCGCQGDFRQTGHQAPLSNRVESVADPHLNQLLFRIYQALIGPVSQMEAAQDRIERNNQKIHELKNWNFVTGIFRLLLTVVCGFVCFWVFIYIGFAIINIFGLERSAFWQIAAVIVFGWFSIGATPSVRDLIAGKINRHLQPRKKAEIAEVERKNTELQQFIQDTANQVCNAISFVPPAYRTSDALKYFVTAYHNSRVDNLKEAVNAYNTHLEAEATRSLVRQAISELQAVQFNQCIMMQQLENLSNDIWLANALF